MTLAAPQRRDIINAMYSEKQLSFAYFFFETLSTS